MGVSFGNLQLLMNILLLVIITFISRNYIGIGTIVNMVLVGYISDLFISIFSSMSELSLSLSTRIILLVVGVVMSSLGVAMYMHSDMGVAPYDAIPAIIENKTNKKIPFNKGRIFVDFLAILIGFLFGTTVGVGTIITACFMGPLIQYFKNFFERRKRKVDTF